MNRYDHIKGNQNRNRFIKNSVISYSKNVIKINNMWNEMNNKIITILG